MSAHDKAAKARARMDQVRREMSERRALRSRNGRAAKAKALDSLMKQGPVAAQVTKHMGELGRRRKAAGGWATEKTERDKDYILGFGGGEDEQQQQDQLAYRPTPPPQADTPPGGIGVFEDEETEPTPPPTPPPAPEAPAARPVRRPAPAREALDDEDDYSNQSSWMRNQ